MLQKETTPKFDEWYTSFLLKRDIDSTIVAGKNPQEEMRKYSMYGKICSMVLEINQDKTTEKELISKIAHTFFFEEDTARKHLKYAKDILKDFDSTINFNFLKPTNWEGYGLNTFDERERARREIAEKSREKMKLIMEIDSLNRELTSKRLQKEVTKEELRKVAIEKWSYNDCAFVRTHDVGCLHKSCLRLKICKMEQKLNLEDQKHRSLPHKCYHCGRPTGNPKFCSDECRERSYKHKRELNKCLLKK